MPWSGSGGGGGGVATTVDQGAAGVDPWLVTGTVDQGAAGVDPWRVTGTLTTSPNLDTPATDAFSRLRVSSPIPLSVGIFNFATGGGNQLLALRYTGVSSGGGSRAAQTNRASVLLSTNGTSGALAVHQTKEYFLYRGGQSHLIFCTFVLVQTLGTNARRRVDYFDANDGVFLQRDADGTMRFTMRTSTSGAPSDTRTVTQANWTDPMNGSGASGITLDFAKRQIMWLDLQFLGTGRVRVGFDVGGVLYEAYSFDSANEGAAGEPVYMRQATLPVRWEIEQTDTGVAASLEAICQAAHREGSEIEPAAHTHAATNGLGNAVGAGQGTVTVVTGTGTLGGPAPTWVVLVVVRLKTNALRASLRDFAATVLNLDNTNSLEVGILLNPTFSGARTWRNITTDGNEIAEFHDGSRDALNVRDPAATVADYGVNGTGYWLNRGYAGAANRGGSGVESQVTNDIPCVADYAGTADEVALVARSIAGTPTCRGTLSFRELY